MAVADIQVTQTAAAAVPSPVATYSPSKNCPVWLSRGPAGEGWRLLADFFTAVTLALAAGGGGVTACQSVHSVSSVHTRVSPHSVGQHFKLRTHAAIRRV